MSSLSPDRCSSFVRAVRPVPSFSNRRHKRKRFLSCFLVSAPFFCSTAPQAFFAKGQWWFEEKEDQTNIRWTYTFTAKGALTAALLTLFVRSQWTGYMKVCLENTRRHFAPGPIP